jgi:hypothetical protein
VGSQLDRQAHQEADHDRVSRAAGRFIGSIAAAAWAAAALSGGAGSAPTAAYTCTGSPAVDEAQLQPLIDAGGSITLHGPAACAGNYVASNVTVAIAGAGGGVTMDGGGTGSVLIADDATVTLSHLTLTRGNGSGIDEADDVTGATGGGVSATDSTLTIDHCRIVGNRADEQGGAIHISESDLTITDSTLADNRSAEGGGGIDADEDVDVTIAGSTITGNATGPHGGGIEAFDGTLVIANSTIGNNAVTDLTDFRSGGGIWTGLTEVSITNSMIRNNSSTEYGGGIGYSGGAGMTITGSTISGNHAALGGGGIRNDAYYDAAPLVIDHSLVTGNTAGQGGGVDVYGLHGFTSSLAVTDSRIGGNRAWNGVGGGIDSYIDPSGGATVVSVAASTIGASSSRAHDGNQAFWGGGIAANGANGSATVVLQPGAALVGNVAGVDGGGVYTRNGATLRAGSGVTWLFNRPNNVD